MFGAWVRLVVNSAVVAAVAVAAQLGAGGALGIIQWDGPHDTRAWSTLLTWLAFSYAVAVLAGAMVGRLAVRRSDGGDGIGPRVTASTVAAVGAAAAVGLAWLPAQDLAPPTNVNPGLVVSLTAGAGVVAGLVLAMLALAARPIAVGLQAMAAWLWLLAIAGALVRLNSDEPALAPRLGVPDAPSVLPDSPWTGSRVLIIVAVMLGLLVSGVARWRGSARLGAALAGFGGPALAAAAYLIAGPGEADGPYVNSLLATAAGLVSSVLVTMPGRRVPRVSRPPAPAPGDPIEGDVIEAVRAEGLARPAWAEGSGPYARAYTSGAPGRVAASTSAPVVAREPVTATTHGTGWDADTGGAPSGGIYRSNPTDPAEDGEESWLPQLRHGGRHAAQ